MTKQTEFDNLHKLTNDFIDATAQAGRDYLYSSNEKRESAYTHWQNMLRVQYILIAQRARKYQQLKES